MDTCKLANMKLDLRKIGMMDYLILTAFSITGVLSMVAGLLPKKPKLWSVNALDYSILVNPSSPF